jgi:hypothetical protein
MATMLTEATFDFTNSRRTIPLAGTPPQPKPIRAFFNLPPEIRFLIYEVYIRLVEKERKSDGYRCLRYHKAGHSGLQPLFLLNRQIKAEAKDVFFKKHSLKFDDLWFFEKFLGDVNAGKSTMARNAKRMQHIAFGKDFDYAYVYLERPGYTTFIDTIIPCSKSWHMPDLSSIALLSNLRSLEIPMFFARKVLEFAQTELDLYVVTLPVLRILRVVNTFSILCRRMLGPALTAKEHESRARLTLSMIRSVVETQPHDLVNAVQLSQDLATQTRTTLAASKKISLLCEEIEVLLNAKIYKVLVKDELEIVYALQRTKDVKNKPWITFAHSSGPELYEYNLPSWDNLEWNVRLVWKMHARVRTY